jgi:hypothetical protein
VRFLKFCGMAYIVGIFAIPLGWYIFFSFKDLHGSQLPSHLYALALIGLVLLTLFGLLATGRKNALYGLAMVFGLLLASPGMCAAPLIVLSGFTAMFIYLPFVAGFAVCTLIGWLIYSWAEARRAAAMPYSLVPPEGSAPPPPDGPNGGGPS